MKIALCQENILETLNLVKLSEIRTLTNIQIGTRSPGKIKSGG